MKSNIVSHLWGARLPEERHAECFSRESLAVKEVLFFFISLASSCLCQCAVRDSTYVSIL